MDVDCSGQCGGSLVIDQCGQCGGDGTSCVGCMDPAACNFDTHATLGNASACVYKLPHHDCDGKCQAELDCHGECGGTAQVDRCGVCGGDDTSCDFGKLEKSVAEAARRDEEARAQRRAAAAAQRQQIGQLEAQASVVLVVCRMQTRA